MKIKKILASALCLTMCLAVTASAGFITGCKKPSRELVNDIVFDEFGDPIFTDENGKGIRLNIQSVIGSPDNAKLELVNTAFNDYYRSSGLQAEISSVENGVFYQQIANTITTDPKNAPDVIIFHSERLTYFASQKILVPMDQTFEFLGDNNTFSTDNYLENVIAECYDKSGTLYGVPLDVHSGVWYVRKDIIEKNGLTMPSTKAEFEAVCKALMEKKADGTLWTRDMTAVKSQIDALSNPNDEQAKQKIRESAWKHVGADTAANFFPVEMSGADNIEAGWIPQSAVLQNGGKLTKDDGTPAWNTSAGLKNTLEMIEGWQDKYIGANRDSQTLFANLGNGNAVFGCEGPWWLEQRLNEYDGYLGEGALGILSLSGLYADNPQSGDAHKIYGVGHVFSITNTAANSSATRRVAAALYAKFMTENAIKYTEGGHLPACKSVLDNPEYKNSTAYNRYLKFMGQPEDYVMLGNTQYFSPVYEQLKTAYIWTLSKNKSGTVEEHIKGCFDEAMAQIKGADDL